ncbi:CU044_2847 family protein [Actinoplanes flavus]|uniref:Trypsin-co-occurring domain-containing protein n=1 Tax=Actinoplanes flavus TaxID=2820290 RepID=A0ABS3UNQ6_9ACTN|nr:CU044_2847 family protein [Actinoplanes flavus]MBO3739307.1 hypothetical protein [Actinoplanes flavus]
MSRPVQIQLPTGEIVWARLDTAGSGPSDVSSVNKVLQVDVDEFRNTIRGVSHSLRAAIDDLVPDQVQIEFGLELAVKTGKITSMLAEAGGKATVKVALSWSGKAPAEAVVTPLPTADDEDA